MSIRSEKQVLHNRDRPSKKRALADTRDYMQYAINGLVNARRNLSIACSIFENSGEVLSTIDLHDIFEETTARKQELDAEYAKLTLLLTPRVDSRRVNDSKEVVCDNERPRTPLHKPKGITKPASPQSSLMFKRSEQVVTAVAATLSERSCLTESRDSRSREVQLLTEDLDEDVFQ